MRVRIARPRCASTTTYCEAEQIFINVGGRALVPPIPGLDQIDYLTNSTMMEIDFRARASDRRRRQLHRTRIRPDVPALRRAGHHRRKGAAHHRRARTPTCRRAIADILRSEGVMIETGAECMRVEKRGGQIAVGLDCDGQLARSRRLASAARAGAGAQYRRPRSGRGGRQRRCARLHRRRRRVCTPASPASGRSAIAMGAARSPTRPTTITKSSPTIC